MVVVGGSIPLVPTKFLFVLQENVFYSLSFTSFYVKITALNTALNLKTFEDDAMPNITLPDGQIKHFENPITVYETAYSISPNLAKAAIAGMVDGALVDTHFLIEKDASLKIVTEKQPEGLEIIRHSAAHLLAQAVKRLFPQAQVTIGPVIENGFYYDFAFERPFTPEDLQQIEKMMYQIAEENLPVSRRTLPRDEVIAYFESLGEQYKAKIIADIPVGETLTLYKQGEFEDLCRGPHVPSTGFLKAFKLTKLAGAYWRGDAKNEMLQRVYGTAWTDKKSLNAYLTQLEEAEKRDHRKIGKAMDLFHFQDIAPGMVFWHPRGWAIYRQLESYMRDRLRADYQEIRTPQLVDRSLWEKSGHWDNFHDEMFITETENRLYAVKPMNCPCHVQVYNQGLRSYRDLPLRFAEFGNCHRCEPSGALHGLMRVRNMVQDDAHIFCTEEQIQSEVALMLALVQSVYQDFGFSEIKYRLALRPDKKVGDDAVWDKAEHALRQAMQEQGIQWVDAPGEGAFYGPKIECSLADCLGRIWQCGTIQVDFSMPERLDARYVAEDSSKKTAVMLHRAILGSFERFMGILIEHYAGKFPLWLAPEQVAILTITEKHNDYAKEIEDFLQKQHIRTRIDLRNEKIGFKIREHTLQKIPYMAVIGEKEAANRTIAVRSREGMDMGIMTFDAFHKMLMNEIDAKR